MDTEHEEEADQPVEENTTETEQQLPQIKLRDLRAERDPMGAGGGGGRQPNDKSKGR